MRVLFAPRLCYAGYRINQGFSLNVAMSNLFLGIAAMQQVQPICGPCTGNGCREKRTRDLALETGAWVRKRPSAGNLLTSGRLHKDSAGASPCVKGTRRSNGKLLK